MGQQGSLAALPGLLALCCKQGRVFSPAAASLLRFSFIFPEECFCISTILSLLEFCSWNGFVAAYVSKAKYKRQGGRECISFPPVMFQNRRGGSLRTTQSFSASGESDVHTGKHSVWHTAIIYAYNKSMGECLFFFLSSSQLHLSVKLFPFFVLHVPSCMSRICSLLVFWGSFLHMLHIQYCPYNYRLVVWSSRCTFPSPFYDTRSLHNQTCFKKSCM